MLGKLDASTHFQIKAIDRGTVVFCNAEAILDSSNKGSLFGNVRREALEQGNNEYLALQTHDWNLKTLEWKKAVTKIEKSGPEKYRVSTLWQQGEHSFSF